MKIAHIIINGRMVRGANVVVVDKVSVITSGSGGAGVDHWHAAVTNPASNITPEEFSQATIDNHGGWLFKIFHKINLNYPKIHKLKLEKTITVVFYIHIR